METINIKLSKKLTEGGYLNNVKYNNYLFIGADNNIYHANYLVKNHGGFNVQKCYKTLTIHELIKFISENATDNGRIYCNELLSLELWDSFSILEVFNIKLGEKMLKYLLRNNLLKIKK